MQKYLLAGLLLVGAITGRPATLIDYGASWKYFIGTSEASSPDRTAWRRPAFSDGAWSIGQAPLGYSTSPNNPAEESLVTFLTTSAQGNYRSVFFRRDFTIHNPASVRELTLTVNVDDGFTAWINGQFAGSYNVPGNELAFDAEASNALEPALIAITITNIQPALIAGSNILAIQVFNANLTSSDLVFDAALSSDSDETRPQLLEVTPPADSTVRELTMIEVLFDENVSGVDAADLRVNDAAATQLTEVSPRNYVFGFVQPPQGTVTVTWAPGNGIMDLAGNPFIGNPWTYTLDTTLPSPSVVISEFMADNQHGSRDEDGDRSDWIELFNSGAEAVNLDAWSLTDSTNTLAKWRLPAMWLDPNRYLLVWASGKNRSSASAPLHTNFKLDKSGAFLALVGPATNVISAFSPAYPAQTEDVSYGRDLVDLAVTGFFVTPTPGSPNATSGPGFAPEPAFSIEQGVYTNNSLLVSISAPAGQIRYTLDGSVPTTNSPAYYGPLAVNVSTTIKARVFQPGLFPGPVIAKTYILLDSSVAKFTSNLPLMIVSTSGRGIVSHPTPGSPRTFASVVAIDAERGRSSPLGTPDYLGQGGISIRGQTSSGFPKRPYRLELQDAYLNDRNAPLLGLPSEADWILNNPYSDKPFLQNFLALELFEKMGHYSVRRKFVEVFVNTTSGKVTYPRDYVGIYVLLEKIKVDEDRVNLPKLTPYDTTEPNISGGYMFKKDKDTTGDLNFTTQGGAGFSAQTLKIHEPVPREITTAQLNWIRNYLRQMETAMYATDWRTRTGTNHYSHFLDVDSFVDQHWIVEFSKQIDGYRLSNYMQKDRGGKVKMEPIWDWNLSFGNADYLGGGDTSGWYYSLLGATEHIWLRRLICGTTSSGGTTGDPDFNQMITDRWSVLRTNVLAASNVLARVDELFAYLNEAAQRDFQKWPRLGTYVWPNSSIYVSPTTYAGIINAMKGWIQGRYNWIDTQFLRAPSFSLNGGQVPLGYPLTVTAPAGTIYYTLNGTDPRAPGGALAAGAQLYRGPIAVGSKARVVARALINPRWSGPTAGTFFVSRPPLLLTEVMYHPGEPPNGSAYDAEDFEFLEIKNAGSNALNLQGFTLSGGVEFTFPTLIVGAGQRVVVAKNRAAFQSRYGTTQMIAGEYTGNLDNAGERLILTGPLGEPVLDFTYKDSWLPITDGVGFSLVLTDESASGNNLSQPAAWRQSTFVHGSPGSQDALPAAFPKVVISEALSNPSGLAPDLIEVQNLSSMPVDIGDWFLSDDRETPMKYRIPKPAVLAPGELRTFSGADFGNTAAPGVLRPFGLSSLGEDVYLFSGGTATNLTGYLHGFKFGAQQADVSFGRYIDTMGREHFVSESSPTFGQTNAGPRIGPVILSEIMYHPPDVFTNGGFWNNTEDEYIELLNISDSPVQLFDPAYPTNTWRITGDVEFSFPTNLSIPANGFVLVANFNPIKNPSQLAAFRSKFAIPAGVPIFGPFSGNLDNHGDQVELSQPLPPVSDSGIPIVPYALVEEVDFDHDLPWSPAADGFGFSLNRNKPSGFGNDPAAWAARLPSPGRAAASAGNPISILQQPVSQLGLAGQTLVLRAAATGGAGLKVQWRFNGEIVTGATNFTLTLNNARSDMSGEYVAVVWGTGSSVASVPAQVSIELDADQDGMPDSWEFAHGFNPYDPVDSSADTDGEGMLNLEEYLAGTDPQDPRSFLKLESSAVSGGCEIWFHAAAFRSYTVLYTDSLNPVTWTRLADVPAQNKGFGARVLDPATSARRYYRLEVNTVP